MKSACYLRLCFVTSCLQVVIGYSLTPSTERTGLLEDAADATSALLNTLPTGDKCLPIFLTHGAKSYGVFPHKAWMRGFGMLEVDDGDGQNPNITHQTHLSKVILLARNLRRVSWCVVVVVVSNDPAFLTTFAEWSLKGRLLKQSTKLLVVTRLEEEKAVKLLSGHWIYSMNDVVMFNGLSSHRQSTRSYNVLVHLPFTPGGGGVKKVGSWRPPTDPYFDEPTLFPRKYRNFHGALLNGTVLPYEPYWLNTPAEGTNRTTTYSGMDYNLLLVFSRVLNFTWQIIPSRTWSEVTQQVEDRKAFFTTMAYVVLTNRYERYDFTRIIATTEMCFGLAKPVATPGWLNFYYPLGGWVWVGVLGTTVVVCGVLLSVTDSRLWQARHGTLGRGAVVMETLGSLLGQGLYGRLSTSQSNHILVGTWLLFVVVMSASYRGSLIASLTLPTLPPRPETVEQLVGAVERATIEPYGDAHKTFFSNSDSPVFKALGNLMHTHVDITVGLKDALAMKRAHIHVRPYLQLMIARHYTSIGGVSPLYVGKGAIILYTLAWPIPHDAPYKDAMDRIITGIVEGGIYEQWRKEIMVDLTRKNRIKQKEETRTQDPALGDTTGSSTGGGNRSLTIGHVQGPLLLLLIGLLIGTIALGGEYIWSYYFKGAKIM